MDYSSAGLWHRDHVPVREVQEMDPLPRQMQPRFLLRSSDTLAAESNFGQVLSGPLVLSGYFAQADERSIEVDLALPHFSGRSQFSQELHK